MDAMLAPDIWQAITAIAAVAAAIFGWRNYNLDRSVMLPSPTVRADITAVDDQPGWYRADIQLQNPTQDLWLCYEAEIKSPRRATFAEAAVMLPPPSEIISVPATPVPYRPELTARRIGLQSRLLPSVAVSPAGQLSFDRLQFLVHSPERRRAFRSSNKIKIVLRMRTNSNVERYKTIDITRTLNPRAN
jgi:hypothetical protein